MPKDREKPEATEAQWRPADVDAVRQDVDDARTEMLVDRLVNPAQRDDATAELAAMYRDDEDTAVADEALARVAERAERADIDWLTGLKDRRALKNDFMTEARRAERRGDTVGLVMFDLHDFKSVNEKFGHDVGDLVIQSASRSIQQALRPGDNAYRIGGDEFALVLPGMESNDAAGIIDRLVKSLPNNPVTRGPVTINPEVVAMYRPEHKTREVRSMVDDAWRELKRSHGDSAEGR